MRRLARSAIALVVSAASLGGAAHAAEDPGGPTTPAVTIPPATQKPTPPKAPSPSFTLQDLRTPTAPGFVLLGVAPALIQRPTTPKAFAVSLLSTVSASDNLLPSDYAVEAAPYWLTSRQELDYATWANPSILQSIQQTFSLSIAASKGSAKQAGFADQTDLSFGARASILAGKATASTLELRARQTEYLILDMLLAGAVKDVPLDVPTLKSLEGITKDLDSVISAPDLSPAQREALVAAVQRRMTVLRQAIESGLQRNDAMVTILSGLSTSTQEALQRLALAIQKANTRRAGWLLDVAGASAYRVPNQSAGDWRRVSSGFWITPGYRRADGRTDFVAALRIINRTEPVDGTVFDYGARIVHEIQDLVFSVEALRRTGDPVDGFSGRGRIDAAFDYKLADGFYLTASFGKGFNQTGDPANKGGLLGALGLSLGFGEKPTIKAQ